MNASAAMNRTSGGRASPLLVRTSGPENKKMGAQRQRMGKVLRVSLMGSFEVSARAVREMPRM